VHAARRPLTGDLDARHLIAQFERQFEPRRDSFRPWVERKLSLGKTLAARRQRMDDTLTRDAVGAEHLRFETPALAEARRQRQRLLSRSKLDQRRTAATRERDQLIRCSARFAIVIDAIGDPVDRSAGLAFEGVGEGAHRLLAVGCVWIRLHGGRRCPGLAGGFDLQVGKPRHACGRRNDNTASGLFGLVDQPLHLRLAFGPARCCCPAIIDHDRNGARAGNGAALQRVQYRICQRKNHQRRRQHADQRQPPRRAIGLLFLVFDANENARRWKLDALGRWRHGAQQPPDRR
jgi:hypothetical protein